MFFLSTLAKIVLQAQINNELIRLKFNDKKDSDNIIQILNRFIRSVKRQKHVYSLPVNLHKHQLYLLEQHSESFNIWSAIIRINTEGKSLIMKLGPGVVTYVPHSCKFCLMDVSDKADVVPCVQREIYREVLTTMCGL